MDAAPARLASSLQQPWGCSLWHERSVRLNGSSLSRFQLENQKTFVRRLRNHVARTIWHIHSLAKRHDETKSHRHGIVFIPEILCGADSTWLNRYESGLLPSRLKSERNMDSA